MALDEPPDSRTETAGARLVLFGHEASAATVRLLPRSQRWRTLRALRVFGIGLLLTPLVALVPPHAPWALGALVGSTFLARRRFRERTTLLALEGACPRCGQRLRVDGPVPLREPHAVPCEACHHESTLHVDPHAVPRPPSADGPPDGGA